MAIYFMWPSIKCVIKNPKMKSNSQKIGEIKINNGMALTETKKNAAAYNDNDPLI